MKDRLKNKLKKLKSKSAHEMNVESFPAQKKLDSMNKDAKINAALEHCEEATEDLFIIIKKDTPHLFEGFKEVIFKEMTSEEIEEFYARVARKEDFAAGRATEPPPPFVMPKRKEYEMPAEHNEYLEKLAEMIEHRDENQRLIPLLPPEMRAEAALPMQRLNESIEEFEQKLAEAYEAFQEEQAYAEARRSNRAVHRWMQIARRFLFMKKYFSQEVELYKEALMEREDWLDIARWIDRLAAEGYDPPPAPVTEN